MPVSFRPLPGAFGAEILDLDLSRDQSEATMREVLSIFYEHQFIAIRGQKLQLSEFDSFSRCFGTQRPHFLDHLRMDGHPAILMLSNIHESGRQIGIYEGACFWHTDVAYEDPPNSATIVYAIDTPKGEAAPTYLADMFAAYDALTERTKRMIDGLIVLHHYGNRYDTKEGSPTAAERLTEDQKQRVQNVHHPLVIRHPVTGRRSLYGVAGSSFGIVGMPDDEAFDLLHELAEHATKPEFTTAYDYAPGDVACWDTYSTLHKAPGQKAAVRGDPHARLLWRVSVTGTAPLAASRQDQLAPQAAE
ncbi:TauD/TfdA dioxygenase family protein [Sphingosinicella rhizophila]|uniref:TauD/TfdA family dioxygenase n=1 Tax=Sphingosinicella rhizophila TaxID=3050082 RepID=A0ABU3Q8J3_9SPHN|nr:TauD/TfdA family dioxygenase [Sphingosinicella sp. GR2756]MDT9599726.1 TauD/TfdA family dioxygenase [Sphingosinicella sp. GR2756]